MNIGIKMRIRFYALEFIFNLTMFAGIGACAWFNGKIIETAFVLVSYFALRYTFPKTKHFEKILLCGFWSIAIFWLAMPFTLPISISIFSSVLSGLLITYILYVCRDYEDMLKNNKKKRVHEIFEMSKERFLAECSRCGLDDKEKQIAVVLIIERKKGTDFYEAIGYCERHAQRKRAKICKKLRIEYKDLK